MTQRSKQPRLLISMQILSLAIFTLAAVKTWAEEPTESHRTLNSPTGKHTSNKEGVTVVAHKRSAFHEAPEACRRPLLYCDAPCTFDGENYDYCKPPYEVSGERHKHSNSNAEVTVCSCPCICYEYTNMFVLYCPDANFHITENSVQFMNSSGLSTSKIVNCPYACVCMEAVNKRVVIDCSGMNYDRVPEVVNDVHNSIIVELHLDYNQIVTLPSYSFIHLPELRNLSITNNLISDISTYTFVGLYRLQWLMLDNNEIGLLPDFVFTPLGGSLLHLHLASSLTNKVFLVVTPYTFSNLTKVRYLTLRSQKINVNLPANLFKDMAALETLDLQSLSVNDINTLKPDIFGGLDALETIHLSSLVYYVMAWQLQDNLFELMPSLKYLNIYQDRIQTINPKAFMNVSKNLIQINIDANMLTYLQANCFARLPFLKRLSLAWNRITQISSAAFVGLQHLEYLDLTANPITQLPDVLFSQLPSLTDLEIVGTCLSTVNAKAFIHVSSKLKIVTFSIGQLTDLDFLIINNVSLLRDVASLEYVANLISSFELDDLHVVPGLTRLDLSGNKIAYFCGHHRMQNWSNEAEIVSNINSSYSIRSEYKSHDSRLEELRLNHNLLKEIPANCFKKLSNLVILDLSRNKITKLDALAFAGLVRLQLLNLFGNYLTTHGLVDFVFSPLIQLTDLNLGSCYLTSINDEAFVNLTTLIHLTLSYNKDFDTFPLFVDRENKELLPNLKYLDMGFTNVNFTDFNYCNFSSFKNINSLFLTFSKIGLRSLNNLLSCTPQLKFLDLTDAPIFLEESSNISNTIQSPSLTNLSMTMPLDFPIAFNGGLPNLSVLSLPYRYVGLWDLTPLKLQNLPNLNTLELLFDSNSFLPNLSRDLLQNVSRIKRLVIHNGPHRNQIRTKINFGDILSNCPDLEVLHLVGIGITTMNASSLPSRLWKQLKEIDFSFNPYVCDCGIVWFHRLLKTPSMIVLQIENSSAYSCDSPERYWSTPIRLLPEDFGYDCFADRSICTNFIYSMWFLSTFTAVSLVAALVHRGRWHFQYFYFFIQIRVRRRQELTDHRPYDYDAFVLYSQHESAWVIHQLSPRLESPEVNLRLCLHHRDWLGGRAIVENITESMESSRKCLLIVSNAFASSQWCHFEMSMAQARSVHEDRQSLILVLLEEIDDINMTPMLLMLMQTHTYIELPRSDFGEQLFWYRLKEALRKPLERTSAVVPSAENFVDA